MRRLAWIGLAALAAWLQAWPGPAVADAAAQTVAQILDADTLRLEDGREIRLTGLRVSRPADRWSRAARALLQDRALGRRVALDPPEPGQDRRGRLLAQVTTADGLWLQGLLLEAGLARVETFADNHRRAPDMLAIEAAARAAGRGLWSDPRFRVLSAEEAETAGEGIHLVEGRVVRVVERRDRFYLDFGQDWRRDFSVTILKRDRAAFKAAGLDPAELGDARLRVRGWMRMFNGPMIDLTHPQQIERLP
ncbi:MAG: thermonuclease family protein [Rhodospirillales bacterium]|nr:thermonuclease family protein [Rhodospirillales bacterium]